MCFRQRLVGIDANTSKLHNFIRPIFVFVCPGVLSGASSGYEHSMYCYKLASLSTSVCYPRASSVTATSEWIFHGRTGQIRSLPVIQFYESCLSRVVHLSRPRCPFKGNLSPIEFRIPRHFHPDANRQPHCILPTCAVESHTGINCASGLLFVKT